MRQFQPLDRSHPPWRPFCRGYNFTPTELPYPPLPKDSVETSKGMGESPRRRASQVQDRLRLLHHRHENLEHLRCRAAHPGAEPDEFLQHGGHAGHADGRDATRMHWRRQLHKQASLFLLCFVARHPLHLPCGASAESGRTCTYTFVASLTFQSALILLCFFGIFVDRKPRVRLGSYSSDRWEFRWAVCRCVPQRHSTGDYLALRGLPNGHYRCVRSISV